MKKVILLGIILIGLVFAIQPAESWTVGGTGKYTQQFHANVTTEGGNVTNVDLSSNISTEKWAGYWGNISGEVVLSPGTNLFYTWAWTSANGGEVCAVAAQSGFSWSTVQATAAVAIDNIWGFSGVDNAANTLNDASCNVFVAGNPIVGSTGSFTGVGGFETCAVADGAGPVAKSDIAFCANITQNGALFNGQPGDYELLAATNETAGGFETHYFWLELD